MNTTEVKEMVRNWYGGIAAGSESCCGSPAAPQEASWGVEAEPQQPELPAAATPYQLRTSSLTSVWFMIDASFRNFAKYA